MAFMASIVTFLSVVVFVQLIILASCETVTAAPTDIAYPQPWTNGYFLRYPSPAKQLAMMYPRTAKSEDSEDAFRAYVRSAMRALRPQMEMQRIGRREEPEPIEFLG